MTEFSPAQFVIVQFQVLLRSGLPKIAAMSGLMMLSTSALTMPVTAAPMTTPTAISTILPRAMNFLNPSNMFRLLFDVSDGVALLPAALPLPY